MFRKLLAVPLHNDPHPENGYIPAGFQGNRRFVVDLLAYSPVSEAYY